MLVLMGRGYDDKRTSVLLLDRFVWCPKRRRRVLRGAIGERLVELLHEKCGELGLEVIALGVMPGDVRLFVGADPDWAPKQIAYRLKGYTSRVLRQEFPDPLMRMPSLWTRSLLVSTAGSVPGATVERYIAQQRTRE